MGVATAVNTAGSILGSLCVGFWWIPLLGMDSSLYLLLLLQLVIGLLSIIRFQTSTGLQRLAAGGVAGLCALAVVGGFNGVHIEKTIVGRMLGDTPKFPTYQIQLEKEFSRLLFSQEGKSSIVSE